MKTYCLILYILGALNMPAAAEERALIGDLGEVDHSGFGGPVVKFSQINGEFGVLVGGRGGWVIDHRFVLGGGGYGLTNSIEAEGLVPPGQDLEMGYGGGMLEFIIASDALMHFSVEMLIGAGGITTTDNQKDDSFFVMEPGANLMLNITHFMRVGAGLSYRFIRGANWGDIGDSDLSGTAAVLTFKFGTF